MTSGFGLSSFIKAAGLSASCFDPLGHLIPVYFRLIEADIATIRRAGGKRPAVLAKNHQIAVRS